MLERLKNWLIIKLFCAVDIREVLTITKEGRLYLGKDLMTEVQQRNLKAEVKFFKETQLAKILFATLAEHARLTMFERSTTYDDMKSGKLMLLAIDQQKQIIDTIDRSVV